MFDPFAPVQMVILISLCIVFWAWILYKSLTMSPGPRRSSYPGLTDFEARQRGLDPGKKDDAGKVQQ